MHDSTITIRISASDRDRLDAAAKADKVDRSVLLRRVIVSYLAGRKS